jgi:hypothetical protein
MVIPYAPSCEWYSKHLGNIILGCEPPSVASLRDVTRCNIRTASGDAITLTVPVVGGASALKHLKYEQLVASEHGNWRHVHIGALEAAYGKTPFFAYYIDDIKNALSMPSQMITLLNKNVYTIIESALHINEITDHLKREFSNNRFTAILADYSECFDPNVSVLDLLFRKGPHAVFSLLSPFISKI